ncbi:MAG: DUF3368 domain-containing protein [Dehalococcoidia bacterium]
MSISDRGNVFYADATALIGLSRINRLDHLNLLPVPIRVTITVWNEIAADPGKPGVEALQKAREARLLIVVEEGDSSAFPGLDPGEWTVLSAASSSKASVLLDERKARTLVAMDPALLGTIRQMTGIVGLLLLAKRQQRILVVRPLLEELLRQHFRLSRTLYQDILLQAGEL